MLKNEEITLYEVMIGGHNSLDIFTKLDFVKDLIRKRVGNLSDQELQIAICHSVYHKSGRKKHNLTQKEYEVLDVLLKNNLVPKTVYRWFLLKDAPDHIKEKIRERKIGLDRAISENARWKKMTSRQGSQQLIEDIREIIGGLRWKSQEN